MRFIARNLTDFFNKELLVYSLGDIKLSRPIPLKKMAMGIAAFVVWTVPFIMIFGTSITPWWLIFAIGPPLAFTQVASKPVFGGKRLFDFIKTAYKYALQPKGWSDLVADNTQQNTVYFVEHETSISRRKELNLLSKIARQRSLEEQNKQLSEV